MLALHNPCCSDTVLTSCVPVRLFFLGKTEAIFLKFQQRTLAICKRERLFPSAKNAKYFVHISPFNLKQTFAVKFIQDKQELHHRFEDHEMKPIEQNE